MYTLFSDFFLSQSGFFRLFCYTTTRCAFAFTISFLIVFLLMPKYISFSHRWQISGQPIRDNYLPEHIVKKGTPTMGGLIFVIPTIITTIALILTDKIELTPNLLIILLVFVGYSFIGFLDDFLSIKKKNNEIFLLLC